ncbi:RND family transporter [Candidatus Riflebacteria bacterium]
MVGSAWGWCPEQTVLQKILSFPLNFARTTILFFILLTIFCFPFLQKIEFLNDLESSLANHSENLTQYRKFCTAFGNDETIIIGFQSGGIELDSLLSLLQLEKVLLKCQGIKKVISILSLIREHTQSEDTLKKWLAPRQRFERFLKTVSNSRLARLLISTDGKNLVLLCSFARVNNQKQKRKMVHFIEKKISQFLKNKKYHLLGYPVIEERVLSLIKKDNSIFFPLAIGAGTLTAWFFLRNLRCVFYVVLSILSAVIWLLPLFSLGDYKLSPFSIMIFPLIFSVGLATAIHLMLSVISHLHLENKLSISPMQKVFPPCFFSTITTAIGFLSLCISPVREIKMFGCYAGIGVIFTLFSSFFLLPALLKFAPPFVIDTPDHFITPLLFNWMAYIKKIQKILYLICLLITVLACYGLFCLQVESVSISGFKEKSPVSLARKYFEQNFPGIVELELDVELLKGRWTNSLAAFRKLKALQEKLQQHSLVHVTLSPVDIILDLASRIAARKIDSVPTARELQIYVDFLRSRQKSQLLLSFIDAGESRARILLKTSAVGSYKLLKLTTELKEIVAAMPGMDYKISITGRNLLSALVHKKTLENEKKSFLLSFLFILLTIFIVFRSPKITLLSLVPNLCPILLSYSLMGLSGVYLDISMGIIGCVSLGLVVDDTIHFLYFYKEKKEKGLETGLALEETILLKGKPIIATSLILIFGLSVLAFASFKMSVNFGLFMMFTVFAALLCDLVILPLLLLKLDSEKTTL